MKGGLLFIAFGLLSTYMVSQYTYFNNGYLPPYPEIGSGGTTNLFAKGDTLITYGNGPFAEEFAGRVMLYLDSQGNLVTQLEYGEGDDIHIIDYSDTVLETDNGYVWAGGNYWYPIVLWMNSDFAENYRIEIPELFSDTTRAGYLTSTILSNGDLICTGKVVYDFIPEAPGEDTANLILAKYTQNGQAQWFHEYSAEELGINTELYVSPAIFPRGGITELTTGEILVFGSVGATEDLDCYAFKFDSFGNYLDHVKWGNPEYPDGSSWPIRIANDKFLFAYSKFSHMEGSWYMYKPIVGRLDTNDMTIIEFSTLDHPYSYGGITDFEATADGNYILLGTGHEYGGEDHGRAYIIKVDPWGNEFWFKEYFPPEPWDTPSAYDLEVTSDGGFAFVGNYHPYDVGISYYKTWVVKTDACGDLEDNGCAPVVSTVENKLQDMKAYPNPSSGTVFLDIDNEDAAWLECYDITGKLVYSQTLNASATQYRFDLGNFSNGAYRIRILDSHRTIVTSATIIKH